MHYTQPMHCDMESKKEREREKRMGVMPYSKHGRPLRFFFSFSLSLSLSLFSLFSPFSPSSLPLLSLFSPSSLTIGHGNRDLIGDALGEPRGQFKGFAGDKDVQ